MSNAMNVTRIGCLHAHHGNIAYLDEALTPFAAEAAHFVDPALVRRIANDPGFSDADARRRVQSQLAWMAESRIDGIVVTCTAYAAAMPEEGVDGVTIPIVAIDEPFFAEVCRARGPQGILFTNPGTVDGTMRRLLAFAATQGTGLDPRVELIPDAFDLFMAGRQDEHDAVLAERLGEYVGDDQYGSVFAAQLSMTTAARRVVAGDRGRIGNPLDALSGALAERFGLQPAGTV